MSEVSSERVSEERLKLWFFRDLSSVQRLRLFALFGLPVAEIGDTHDHQTKAFRHLLRALRSSVKTEESQKMLKELRGVIEEVKRTEEQNNRNPGTDYRARVFFRDFGAELLSTIEAPAASSEVTAAADRQAVEAGQLAAFEYSKSGGGPIGVFTEGLRAYRAALTAALKGDRRK